jgi:hypothetical protein
MSSKRARESPAPGEQGKRQKVTKATLVFPGAFNEDDKHEVRAVSTCTVSSTGSCHPGRAHLRP